MKHPDATRFLADYCAGRMVGSQLSEIEKHVGGCGECRSWVESYEFLAEGLRRDAVAASAEHPSSEALARLAADSAATDLKGQIGRHLRACSSCNREFEVVRASLENARSAEEAGSRPWGLLAAVGSPKHFAVAASILIALVLGFFFMPGLESETEQDQILTGVVLAGKRVVEADRSIVASGVEIESGSTITFRAKDVVVLSDGFVVGGGADFTVEVDRSSGAQAVQPAPENGSSAPHV